MAGATARVAVHLAGSAIAALAALAAAEALATTIALATATAIGRSLRAAAGNVADFTALYRLEYNRLLGRRDSHAYLVALLAAAAATLAAGSRRAVTRDVTGLAAPVAGLGILGALGAVTAYTNVSREFVEQRRNVCTHSCGPRLKTEKPSCQCNLFVGDVRLVVMRAYHRSCS